MRAAKVSVFRSERRKTIQHVLVLSVESHGPHEPLRMHMQRHPTHEFENFQCFVRGIRTATYRKFSNIIIAIAARGAVVVKFSLICFGFLFILISSLLCFVRTRWNDSAMRFQLNCVRNPPIAWQHRIAENKPPPVHQNWCYWLLHVWFSKKIINKIMVRISRHSYLLSIRQ